MPLPLPTLSASPTFDPHLSQPQPQPHPHPHPHPHPPRQPKSPLATSPSRPITDTRSNTFPFSFTRSVQPNPSSTSIVPSVAEGRPIPVDDSTVEYRISALRELNHHYPSRHRYARSTGAQSSTYSEPVIVRSYYAAPLLPSRPPTSSRGSGVHSGAVVSVAGLHSSRPATTVSRGQSFTNKAAPSGSGLLSTMVLARGKKPVNGRTEEEARLPPVDAFTFKSFMANIESQGGGTAGDINADLDRIAEICARSRYSLSNQYEVHYTPHGSGNSFLASTSQASETHGPTLQAITPDDETNISLSQRRRRMARRNSRAVGTLETIMSSSRSSDEERTGNRSAAEIAGEIRGRATRRESGASSLHAHSNPNNSLDATPERQLSRSNSSPSPVARKKSASSLALIDGARQSAPSLDFSVPRSSSTNLVSEPALPQASTSQLEIRTLQSQEGHNSLPNKKSPPKHVGFSVANGAITPVGVDASTGILSFIVGWIPWKSSTTGQPKHMAEGSLRELLNSKDAGSKIV